MAIGSNPIRSPKRKELVAAKATVQNQLQNRREVCTKRLNTKFKRVWRWHSGALSQNSLARSLARTTIEDYYADRKVTLRVLYYDMTR